MDKFSKTLKELRNNIGISQRCLAKEIGLGKSSISSWEQGSRIPNIYEIVQLAKYFNVSTDYLLGLEE